MKEHNNMPPLESFNSKATDLIRLMHEVAIDKGQNTIKPLHLFAAFLIDENNIAVAVLKKQKVDTQKLLDYIVDDFLEDGEFENETTTALKQIYIDSSLVDVLNRSQKVIKDLGGDKIGPEHLFFALLIDAEKNIFDLSQKFNFDLTKSLNLIIDLLKNNDWKNVDKKGGNKSRRYLDKFAKNLNILASENKLDPVIGREKEVSRLIEIISRKKKNNPLLIGDAGVGKTAIVEAVAQKIVAGMVPRNLIDKEIYSLDMGALIAGTKFRGEFEDRLKKIISEVVSSNGKIILFIDEIHTIVGAGVSDGALDASNILKPSLARGELSLIGATTYDEYKKHIEKDNALNRRFQTILVKEPTKEETLKILDFLKKDYEQYHGIKIKDEALKSAVELSVRYIPDRFLPDKAIDLIDEASSIAKVSIDSKPNSIQEVEEKIIELELKKISLEKKNKDDKNKKELRKINSEIKELKNNLEERKVDWSEMQEFLKKISEIKNLIFNLESEVRKLKKENKLKEAYEIEYIQLEALNKSLEKEEKKFEKRFGSFMREVGKFEIEQIVSKITQIPVEKMSIDDNLKLKKLERILKSKIIGQDKVIEKITKFLKRAKLGITDPEKPLASFVFVGPTGVGKTEVAKVLASEFFEDEKALVKIDMSELMESHSVSKLIGSPPGYVGYDKGGSLTEKIRKNPYSIVLFDEIEKADSDVLNILLQILDEGKLTDSKGIEVNFKNTIIILTSNLGFNDDIIEENKIELVESEKEDSENEKALSVLKKYLSPEFINRIDAILAFNKLDKKEILEIAKLEIDKISQRLKSKKVEMEISDKALEKIIFSDEYNFNLGARPLKKILDEKIIDVLVDKILEESIQEGKFKIGLNKKKELEFKFEPVKGGEKIYSIDYRNEYLKY